MSRKVVVLLAAMLGVIGGTLVLPVSEANAAMCARPPKLGVGPGDCEKYQCTRQGPCGDRRRFVRRGCLRYICTAMVPAGGLIPGTPPVPVPPGGPGRPPPPPPR